MEVLHESWYITATGIDPTKEVHETAYNILLSGNWTANKFILPVERQAVIETLKIIYPPPMKRRWRWQ